jgi:GGDEF domain-containing protein
LFAQEIGALVARHGGEEFAALMAGCPTSRLPRRRRARTKPASKIWSQQ